MVQVLASPRAFGNATFYCTALLGLVYCNAMHWHRARQLRQLQLQAPSQVAPAPSDIKQHAA